MLARGSSTIARRRRVSGDNAATPRRRSGG